MCGIWSVINGKTNGKANKMNASKYDKNTLYECFSKVSNRGPECSRFSEYYNNGLADIFLGFHRLAIMDPNENSMQPMIYIDNNGDKIYGICNGEIYNADDLKEKYNILENKSDCYVLLQLFLLLDKKTFLQEVMNNEFSFVFITVKNTGNIEVFFATDPFSVRPLFYSYDDSSLALSSVLGGLVNLVSKDNNSLIKRLPGGTYGIYNIYTDPDQNNKDTFKLSTYYDVSNYINFHDNLKYDNDNVDIDTILSSVKNTFETAVHNMMPSDRKVGALLSGGLDSSLVVSILSQKIDNLNTFSIGIKGGTDEYYANLVAKHCNTNHTHVLFTKQEFLDAIPTVVNITETYDITTIRASVGQYLLSKWIAKNTDIKVLFVGDGSDEFLSGYMYFHCSPSPIESHKENCRLLQDIHLYDGLRADRCIAGNGLEARLPFLNVNFVNLILETNPSLRIPINEPSVDQNKKIEKWLLRKAFDNTNYLPSEVLWRKKEAFSDGVSSENDSWYIIIQNYVKTDQFKLTYPEFCNSCDDVSEVNWYKYLFDSKFPNCYNIIPYYWMPKWTNATDPSARTLDVY